MSDPSVISLRRRAIVRDRSVKWAFLLPAMIFVAIFFGYPIVQNAAMSFQEYTTRTFFTGEAPFIGLQNYIDAFTAPVFPRALMNTFLFTVGSIALQFCIGLGLALFFNRRFPLSIILRSLLLLPWLLPLLVSSTVWRGILDTDSGIFNAALESLGLSAIPWLTNPDVALLAVILVNVWIGIPFNVVILYSGLQDIPTELYEAASLDGSSRAQTFWWITLPMLRPVVMVVLLLGVIYTVKVLDIVLALTGGGPANATQTLALQAYEASFVNFNFGLGAAFGNVLIVISLIFAAVYLRLNRKAMNS
ncbi:ABC transporter permease [Microbacterium faecale]|uniref:ABC transporter permease n=1 Tax=Microbacterium faecale TaxID=1804630 RepID=A0A917DCK3_9MICO|nr:sugar ABC transporter permease [Microbacterium faecale]GGD26718.1 ABC transporter permease [Microbacterium faecale]